jgi:transposase
VELDPTRMCQLLVGLPDVEVLGVAQPEPGELVVMIEQREDRPSCGRCGSSAWVKDHREVDLVDLPAFGQTVLLRVLRTRWSCPRFKCGVGSWSIEHLGIAPAGHRLTTRAARWVTEQVGRCGRTVNEIAVELGADWHTINTAVITYGNALLEADVDRIGVVHALSLDETLVVRRGQRRRQEWSTQIVDARSGTLLDIVEGRDSTRPAQWLDARPDEWLGRVQWGVMDLSGPYKSVFDTMLPDAGQVADPFHVIKHANTKLDECRRRVQNETLGHRGRKADPLYRCRKLMLMAEERVDIGGQHKLQGLLRAGDPHGEVAYAWHAKEAVRFFYDIPNPDHATRYLSELASDLQDDTFPIEVRSLGRTLQRWFSQICNWHRARASNGPIKAINNLIKRVKRVAFGFRRFDHYRIRALLYAGRPDWSLLDTITPH